MVEALGVTRVHFFETVTSTQDLAHAAAAAGDPAGTLVLADAQTAGRGRMGRSWQSEKGAGLWMTMVERPVSVAAVEVLSLRVGLRLAAALETLTALPVMLKWPNDLMLAGHKLGGILIEARWREAHIDWVAIGVGINLIAPATEPKAIGLGPAHSRLDVLRQVVPAIRDAAGQLGVLGTEELDAFARRDWLRGRRARLPVAGTVAGIDSSGALVVVTESGSTTVRAGALVLAEES